MERFEGTLDMNVRSEGKHEGRELKIPRSKEHLSKESDVKHYLTRFSHHFNGQKPQIS